MSHHQVFSILTTLIFVSFLNTPSAGANTPIPSTVTDETAQLLKISMAHWTFRCDQTPQTSYFPQNILQASPAHILEGLKSKIPQILLEGLNRIARLNPDMIRKALRSAAMKRLTIDCKSSGERGYKAMYNGSLHELDMGTSLFILGPAQDPMNNGYLSVRETLVHEFLHHISLDNNDGSYHNSWGAEDQWTDVVYSCGGYAFPAKAGKGHGERSICETCALARFNQRKARTSLDPSPIAIKKARELCSGWQDPIW